MISEFVYRCSTPPRYIILKQKERLHSKAEVLNTCMYAAVLRLMTCEMAVTLFWSEQEKIIILAYVPIT